MLRIEPYKGHIECLPFGQQMLILSIRLPHLPLDAVAVNGMMEVALRYAYHHSGLLRGIAIHQPQRKGRDALAATARCKESVDGRL